MAEIVWPHEELKRHLSGPGPKRILALDGGGVRGLLTLGMLQRVEDVLREQSGRGEDFRLSDYFDLIAGTSTGSIIGALLALGRKVSEVRGFYEDFAPKVFSRTQSLGLRTPKFDERTFERLLQENLGELKVGSPELKTGLLVCAKRMDTGSQWAINNNPLSKYYTPQNAKTLPNREYYLRTLVRASTAAPFYFKPVRVTICDHPDFEKEVGAFVDGGVGGDNNPSLQAFRTVTLPGYNFNWPTGADNIFMLSLGTGWRKPLLDIDEFHKMWNMAQTVTALAGMIQESVQQNIITMQAMSAASKRWYVNREIGDMENMRYVKEPLLTFRRCDAMMENEDIVAALGLRGAKTRRAGAIAKGLLQMDNASKANLRTLYTLGCAAAGARPDGKGVDASDFPDAFKI